MYVHSVCAQRMCTVYVLCMMLCMCSVCAVYDAAYVLCRMH